MELWGPNIPSVPSQIRLQLTRSRRRRSPWLYGLLRLAQVVRHVNPGVGHGFLGIVGRKGIGGLDSTVRTGPARGRNWEFKNAVLGESFVPPGGRLTLDVFDRCRRDYLMRDGCKEKTFMGVDVGIKLYMVIRKRLDSK